MIGAEWKRRRPTKVRVAFIEVCSNGITIGEVVTKSLTLGTHQHLNIFKKFNLKELTNKLETMVTIQFTLKIINMQVIFLV